MPSWSTACFGSFKKDADGFYDKNISDVARNDNRESVVLNGEDRKGMTVVELEKKEGTTLGLIISGGIDKNSRPKVSNLRPGSIAHRSDVLAVGDHIISVNGILTSKLKHEEIVNLLKNAGTRVSLEIEYDLPPSLLEKPQSVTTKVIQVKLEKENDSFGFTLRGGACSNRSKSRPLTVTHVRFGGPANRIGIIKAGDRLLAVDGINLSMASLQETLQLIKQLKQPALFTIEYDVSVIDAVKNATGPLLVEIEKTPGCLLGINLSCISVPDHAIVIESIRQASVAERCGALHVGDHILAIDDIKVDYMTAAEAMQLIKSSSSETLKLEILPMSQIALRSTSDINTKKGIRRSFNAPNICPLLNVVVPSSSDASLASSKSYCTSVGHADRTDVALSADHKGFGLMLQGSSYPSDILTTPPIINCIDHGSPAERSGVLQVGDRVLAVNGESTEGLTLEDVRNMITHSHPRVVLTTEFDVAEAVVPSSGTFVVKLIKRGADLGISVTAPRNRYVGEPLIISDIRKGSVAHRTGSIQPGDKLLAINSLRMENCTVEDALSILHTSTDIVKLRIKKDEMYSEDPDSTCAIVYTVELVRHGGPLGITVSGTEDPFDPIYISGLTENGLAERTGALHVGDRIIAINGNSLRGKALNEAICILQTCGDRVTMKISRCSCPGKSEADDSRPKCLHCTTENELKTFSTPLPSVDSAVDSWDSSNLGASMMNAPVRNEQCSHSFSDGHLSTLYQKTCEQATSDKDDSGGEQCNWVQKNMRSNSFCGTPSDEEKESWEKVLEDLQTCGQSELLRQIEHSILGSDGSDKDDTSDKNNSNGSDAQIGALSETNLQELNSQIEQLRADLGERDAHNSCLTELLNHRRHKEYVCRHSICSDSRETHHPSTYSFPFPIEVHKVTLFKDQVYEDFGFSLSDGKYESGVFINSIRPGGPADKSGLIKPLDRILQVNNVKTYNAGLIVPLIAASGDRIELIISRPAYNSESSSESTLGRTSNYHPWVEDGHC